MNESTLVRLILLLSALFLIVYGISLKVCADDELMYMGSLDADEEEDLPAAASKGAGTYTQLPAPEEAEAKEEAATPGNTPGKLLGTLPQSGLQEIPEDAQPVQTTTALYLPQELEDCIDATADRFGLDPVLVRAVIWVESRGQVDADNGLCYGLMQINMQYEDTFLRALEVDSIKDPKNNILAGCWWLSEMMAYTGGQEVQALMCYNLGCGGAQDRWEDGIYSTAYTDAVLEAKKLF